MAINLSRIGHAAIRVTDKERAKRWYTEVLGFKVVEDDPEHGDDFFMSLGRATDGHVLDIAPVEDSATATQAPTGNSIGVSHLAFKVDTHEDLRNAYQHLVNFGIIIDRMIEHVNQRSFYFADPDGNRLEIYWEYPTAPELFRLGRGDRDFVFTFDDPVPPWASEVPKGWDPEKTVDNYHRGTSRMMC